MVSQYFLRKMHPTVSILRTTPEYIGIVEHRSWHVNDDDLVGFLREETEIIMKTYANYHVLHLCYRAT